MLVHSFNSDNKIVQILISFSLPLIIALLNPNSFITVMNNFAGPLYILLFIVFPLILAIRNRGYAVWKRALSCVFLLTTLLIIFANVCATLGIWKIHPKAEKEYRELYVNPATAPQNQK